MTRENARMSVKTFQVLQNWRNCNFESVDIFSSTIYVFRHLYLEHLLTWEINGGIHKGSPADLSEGDSAKLDKTGRAGGRGWGLRCLDVRI